MENDNISKGELVITVSWLFISSLMVCQVNVAESCTGLPSTETAIQQNLLFQPTSTTAYISCYNKNSYQNNVGTGAVGAADTPFTCIQSTLTCSSLGSQFTQLPNTTTFASLSSCYSYTPTPLVRCVNGLQVACRPSSLGCSAGETDETNPTTYATFGQCLTGKYCYCLASGVNTCFPFNPSNAISVCCTSSFFTNIGSTGEFFSSPCT